MLNDESLEGLMHVTENGNENTYIIPRAWQIQKVRYISDQSSSAHPSGKLLALQDSSISSRLSHSIHHGTTDPERDPGSRIGFRVGSPYASAPRHRRFVSQAETP